MKDNNQLIKIILNEKDYHIPLTSNFNPILNSYKKLFKQYYYFDIENIIIKDPNWNNNFLIKNKSQQFLLSHNVSIFLELFKDQCLDYGEAEKYIRIINNNLWDEYASRKEPE